jgi:deoxyadenosine/deoxycytidine kinase
MTYRKVFSLVTKTLPPPSLLIYLKAPVPVLIDRIHQRARDIESGIDPGYLELLDSFYEEWIQTFDLCPVLTLRTDDLDFVHHPKHLDTVVQYIQDKLSGKEEIVF